MPMLEFPVMSPKQGDNIQVAFFVATPRQILQMAQIKRLARNAEGQSSGFQRTQIAGHIQDIGEYFAQPDAVLANPIVLGFVEGAEVSRGRGGKAILRVDTRRGPLGYVVDGQQRFSALLEIGKLDFEVPVSVFVCKTMDDLTDQFVRINNSRPLPRTLVNELLAYIKNPPRRHAKGAEVAPIVETLNHRRGCSLRGQIKTHTNPDGVIQDSSIQRVIAQSLSDGALRLYRGEPKLLQSKGVNLLSEFFHAVRHVFRDEWDGHTPTTSRLLHGAGMAAMGFVMEYLHSAEGATSREDFIEPLTELRPFTAWTEGEWVFGTERRRWNNLQNVSVDRKLLSFYLVKQVQAQAEARRKGKHVRR